MGLQQKLEQEARANRAAYFGVADLSLTQQGTITPYETKLVSQFPRAISIGLALSPAVIDSIEDQSDAIALQNYYHHIYEVVSPFIDTVTLRLSQTLMDAGFSAFPIPSTQLKITDEKTLYGIFSHKMAANLAGLGWVGRSCLLITPDRGPRVRWGTVLTDAPLDAGKPVQDKGCGECIVCVEECPASAFTGKAFLPSEPREKRMDANKCWDLLKARKKIGFDSCGLCVFSCPFGRCSRI